MIETYTKIGTRIYTGNNELKKIYGSTNTTMPNFRLTSKK